MEKKDGQENIPGKENARRRGGESDEISNCSTARSPGSLPFLFLKLILTPLQTFTLAIARTVCAILWLKFVQMIK